MGMFSMPEPRRFKYRGRRMSHDVDFHSAVERRRNNVRRPSTLFLAVVLVLLLLLCFLI